MSKYARLSFIKTLLGNKIPFGEPGSTDPNKVSPELLNTLASEAEAQLEIDLMMRYDAPFVSVAGGTFESLPDTSRTILRTMAELIAVIRLLETDFGRGTSTNAEKFTKTIQTRYDGLVKFLMEIKADTYQTWLRPPLPGLKLAYSNQGDTGFRGRIHNTTTISHEADYAYKQINSPAENYFSGVLDPLDRGKVFGG